MTSLRTSPPTEKARTVSVIAIPGQNIIQEWRDIQARASPIMLPHVGVPGSMPAPRKASPNPPKDTDGRREDSGRGVREPGEMAWAPLG